LLHRQAVFEDQFVFLRRAMQQVVYILIVQVRLRLL
jgi:hypothetical protein